MQIRLRSGLTDIKSFVNQNLKTTFNRILQISLVPLNPSKTRKLIAKELHSINVVKKSHP